MVVSALWTNSLRYTISGDKYKCQEQFLKGSQIPTFFNRDKTVNIASFGKWDLDHIFCWTIFVGENLNHLKKNSILSDKVFLNQERVKNLKSYTP